MAARRGPDAPDAYPGEQVFEAEHPIRHVLVQVPGATRLAVVFSGFDPANRPRYNYIERFRRLRCHRLHVLDDLGARGCYYLGRDRDFFVARAIERLVLQRLAQLDLAREDVVTVGSSKGGTAALYHAVAFGYGEAIAGAPQVRIGEYLTRTASAFGVARLIAGGADEDDVAYLDDVLLDAIAASAHRPNVDLFISRADSHYETHLPPLLAALDEHGYRHAVTDGRYASHSAVGAPFSRHVLRRIGTRSRLARSGGVSAPLPVPASGHLVRTHAGAAGSSSLLYRGGFLLHETRRPPQPRSADLAALLEAWPAERIGHYTVRFDHGWTCSHAAAGDTEVVLLGSATHVDRPDAGHAEITVALAEALQASEEGFHDLIDHLSGAHLIVLRSGGRHLLLQDATGMEGVFYDISGRARQAASHPGLLAELEGYEQTEMARWWIAHPGIHHGGEYFPGLLTPYEELRILTPNTRLDLDEGRVERFFPRGPIGRLDLDEVLATVAPRLRNQWRWLVANHDVSVSLTAGLDSRLTMASAREVADELDFFTYTIWGNATHERDVAGAGRLAETLGLQHSVYRVKYREPLAPEIDQVWERMMGGMRGGRVLASAYLSRFPAGNLHVRSNVLETARGFYLKNSNNVRDRFDARKLSRLFRGITAEQFVPHFAEFMRITGFSAQAKRDIHYTDLYYWEHRLGAWHSGVVRSAKSSHATFVLYNCRAILRALLALPLEQRVAADSVLALTGRLWPAALDEPIVGVDEERQRIARTRWTTTPSRSSSSGRASSRIESR